MFQTRAPMAATVRPLPTWGDSRPRGDALGRLWRRSGVRRGRRNILGVPRNHLEENKKIEFGTFFSPPHTLFFANQLILFLGLNLVGSLFVSKIDRLWHGANHDTFTLEGFRAIHLQKLPPKPCEIDRSRGVRIKNGSASPERPTGR